MSASIEKLDHFMRLQTEQQNYFELCNKKINNWQKYKEDYLNLKTRLNTLPHELRYEVTVPLSKVAFMQGRLINTNEVLVLLGDNWFVEKSAKQACDLIDRRLKNIATFLEDLEKEKKNLTEQINWTKNFLKEKGSYVNIEEKYEEVKQNESKKSLSEEEKKEIRRKLQEKALKTSLELESEIKQKVKTNESLKKDIKQVEEEEVEQMNKNDNFMQKLEEDIKNLDNGEKFVEDESLRDLIKEYDQKIDRENNLRIEKALKKQVKWLDVDQPKNELDQVHENDYSESETQSEEEDDVIQDQEPIRIEVKHTKNEAIEYQDRKLKLSRDKPEINSPADIFKVFYKPKSILKNTGSVNLVENASEPESIKIEPKNALMEKFEPQKAFTGEIVEKNVSFIQSRKNDLENQKPVSKFRTSKFSQK